MSLADKISSHPLVGRVLCREDMARYGDRVSGWRGQATTVDEAVRSAQTIISEWAKQLGRTSMALLIEAHESRNPDGSVEINFQLITPT